MAWMPVDTAKRYAAGLPTLVESEKQTDREYKEAEGQAERAARQRMAELAERTQINVAGINASKDNYAEGGTVKDPRATRRDYPKGGAIFR